VPSTPADGPFEIFSDLTAWRRAVLACRLRDARTPPPRSLEVGLLRERARGLATI